MISALFSLLGRIPLRAGYLLADTLAFLAGDVVRYRRKVILKNLRDSFPEKSEREIRQIAGQFYAFLADYFVETLRLGKMSEQEICRRMTFENTALLEDLARRNIPIALMLGHYGNWEWISSLTLHLPASLTPAQIYHPLENKSADKAFLKIRSHFGSKNIPMRDTLRYLLTAAREGKTSITGFIADQSPVYVSTHLWLDFLNHDTGVYTGAEMLMRRLNGAMVYCHIERPKRGYYHCRFELITDDVASAPENEPTRSYFHLLEEQIRAVPHLWLWSHRRWKRPRPAAQS